VNIRAVIRSIRRGFWRLAMRLKHVHATFLMGGYSRISRDLRAGAYSYVGPGCDIGPGVSLGAYTMLGPRVSIVGNDHVFNAPGVPTIFSGRPPFRHTSIGKDVWIGAGATVIAGVTIGDGAIVAAGSIVTRDIESMVIVAGVPARVVRRRFADATSEEQHRLFLASPPSEREYCPPLARGEVA
jgi:acetyltransferase-like isoleucine patch superfamily enzyme